MKQKLNVLLSSSIFPNSIEVTKGIYIFHQAKALAEFCNIKVIAPVPYFPGWIKSETYNFYSSIPGRECIGGLEVLHPRVLITPKIGRSLYGGLYALSLIATLKRLNRSFQPDIIICYWIYPDGFANALLARFLRIPIILGGRGCDINNASEYRMKEQMVAWALRNSHMTLAVSNAMKERITELGIPENQIRVIPNGINSIFRPMDKDKALSISGLYPDSPQKKTILYCGRLSSEKGLSCLIEASKILLERGYQFRVVLVGNGPERENLKQQADSLGLSGTIYFKSEVPHEVIPAVMNSADIFCLPSIREGWPNVLMEALACGLSVVASNVGGVPEILTSEEYGIMVQPQQAGELADALGKAIRKKWDRKKILSATKGRTWESVARDILNTVQSVLAS